MDINLRVTGIGGIGGIGGIETTIYGKYKIKNFSTIANIFSLPLKNVKKLINNKVK